MSIQDDMNESDPGNFIRDPGSGSMHLRRRIPVGILGATGSVGQKLISLLDGHPWFDVTAVCASEKSSQKTYKEATQWRQTRAMPQKVAKLQVLPAKPDLPCHIIFSALEGSIAGEIEEEFARAGYVVISCARSHRMNPAVPLVVPEVNADHLVLAKTQKYSQKGMIVTKPNCAVIGLSIALRPLMLEFGVEQAHVVTMQAISGAGYPGVPSLSLLDNIIPYIAGEEERFAEEPNKLFGNLVGEQIMPHPIKISASCTRVPVTEGHLEVVSIKLKEPVTSEQIKRAWNEFSPYVQELKLPSACKKVIHYFDEEDFPQPKLHRDLENGMAVSIGRLRPCPLFDYKFVLLSHNTIRGAAGGAILIAELLAKEGHVFW